jgi:hypothetical protein
MTIQNIVFSQPATAHAGPNPVVALVFGADGAVVEDPNGVDPATGIYRGAGALVACAWMPAQPQHETLDAPWQEAVLLPVTHAMPQRSAAAEQVHFVAPWIMDFAVANASAAMAYDAAEPHSGAVVVPWGVQRDLAGLGVAAAWQLAASHRDIKVLPWQTLRPTDRVLEAVWQTAQHVAVVMEMPWQFLSTESVQQFIAPWQEAELLSSFGGGVFDVRGAAPVVPVPAVQVPLVFCETYPANFEILGWPASIALAFGVSRCNGGHSGAEFVILPARVYMTVHNVFAQLLPSMANVPIYDATLSADVGSFAWSFSANGPESLFTQLARSSALPVQIKLTIDSLEWVFLVETLRRTAAFGKHGVAITGRSVTALVGEPWTRSAAYNNGSAMTAQQIAAQALDLSGVALDWGITDWLVPTGAWSHNGSRLSAVQRVAEAAGGYLQSHRSAATLQVRHPYPLLPGGVPGGPWNWASVTPDIELAADAVITSGKEAKDGADIDAVYISGTNQGVVALVKRTGTAGAKLAAMQADPLITHVDAATQRGLSILGTAGAKEHVTLELPVLTGSGQPGVIDVGKLVLVNESVPWRGRVRSVNVAYNRPSVRQTITLERHL